MECRLHGKAINRVLIRTRVHVSFSQLTSQVWDIFEGGHLFTGYDLELQTYRSRAHLAEMIALLGPPPPSLLSQGHSSHRFFSDKGETYPDCLKTLLTITCPLGKFSAGFPLPDQISLEERETGLKGQQDKVRFLRLMRKMLQWEPAKRSPAEELVKDEWLSDILWSKK